MAKKRKKKSSGLPIKALIPVVVIIIIVAVFAPKLFNKCDDCNQTFFGTGYYGGSSAEAVDTAIGAIAGLLGGGSDEAVDAEQIDEGTILCAECAVKMEHHPSISLGQHTLEDFKRPLF